MAEVFLTVTPVEVHVASYVKVESAWVPENQRHLDIADIDFILWSCLLSLLVFVTWSSCHCTLSRRLAWCNRLGCELLSPDKWTDSNGTIHLGVTGCGTPWGPTIFFFRGKIHQSSKLWLELFLWIPWISEPPKFDNFFLSPMRVHLVYEDVGHPDEVCLAGDEVEF